MSTYKRVTQHPYTKKWESALWIDDHYSHHHYGVRFDNGDTFDPELHEMKTRDIKDMVYERFVTYYEENKVQPADGEALLEDLTDIMDKHQL
jgi:hypothetical protein